MSSHRTEGSTRAARRADRPRGSGRTRALIALGAVAVLATGLSVKGTFAFFTDTATLNTGSFSSGSLDITLDGALAGPGTTNNPGSITRNQLAMNNMVPGESIAYDFPVANNGTLPLIYTVNGTGSGPLAAPNGMQYSVSFGVTATTSGSEASNNRVGRCGATASTDTNTTLLTASAVPFTTGTGRNLAVGATDRVCIVARFNSNAGNGLQSTTTPATPTTASFVFAASQVGGGV